MKTFGQITLKHRLIIAIPAITAIVWVLVTIYHYHYINNSISRIFERNAQEWMQRYSGFVVDDIKAGNILRVRNTTINMVDDDIFSSVVVRDRKGQVIISYGNGESKIRQGLRDLKKERVPLRRGRKVNGVGGYYYPIVDMYGTKWGEAFIKPYVGISSEIVRGRIEKIVVFAIGVLLLEVAIIILIMQKMFGPLDGLSKSISQLSKKYSEGVIDVEGLRKNVSSLQRGEIRTLGEQVMGFAENIKKYEDQVARMSLSSAIGAMVSHIVHDIRSPISVLRSYVERQKAMRAYCVEGDEEEMLCVGAAERSVLKIQTMAAELISYAKASSVERGYSNIKSILRDAVEEVEMELSKKGIRIDVNGNEERCVYVDPFRIERAFVNLLTNSIHSITTKGGRIAVYVNTYNNSELQIEVHDNGRGIAAENMLRIFDAYFTTDKKHGTGLGLAYCKQVVEAHGGTIEVESEVGKGTTFRIIIPNAVVDAPSDIQEKSDRILTKATALTVPISGHNYAIVDDDRDILDQWRRIIDEKGGRIVYSATNVADVKRATTIDGTLIDTAIVDYHYEGDPETGIDLIAHLKRRGVKHVHLCTGFFDDEDICRRARAAGADSVIPKPIDDGDVEGFFG